jgi:hypothetical protein
MLPASALRVWLNRLSASFDTLADLIARARHRDETERLDARSQPTVGETAEHRERIFTAALVRHLKDIDVGARHRLAPREIDGTTDAGCRTGQLV